MFCINCGTSLPDIARFCSRCGASQAGTPQANSPQPAAPAAPATPSVYTQPSPATSNPTSPRPLATTLLSPTGYPQPAFEQLAGALFHALDQNVQPLRTGGLEVSKMKAYRTMGGLTVPPYYGEHVLPTYASVVGIELVPNQPRSAPIISWNGWHQFLLHKILLEPETTFYHITRLLTALNLQISLNRTDFPLAPDPNALVKEARFRTEIYGLIRMGMRAGAMGGGMGMLGGGMAGASVYGGGNAHISSAAAHAMAQAMNQQASSMFNGSALTGAGFGVNQWFFGGGAGC